VFAVAYVILPFSDTQPAEAIGTSLARFQRGQRGDLPEKWLAFDDETEALRRVYEAHLTFIEKGTGGLQIKGDADVSWYIDIGKLKKEMRRLAQRHWSVRFADTMDLEEFFNRFGRDLERHPDTGDFGRWLNPLGRWDWWDLGGRFDGHIIGDRRRSAGRSVAQVSSGANPGRSVLARLEDQLAEAFGQEPVPTVDVRTDRNVELVATLLEDAQAGRDSAYPGSLVLPPGSVEDRMRWIGAWPELGPEEACAWLGLSSEASWEAVVSAAYARFQQDHWAAGIAYHC
jgi:hypothetical protein